MILSTQKIQNSFIEVFEFLSFIDTSYKADLVLRVTSRMEKYPIAMTAIKKTGLREPPGSNLAVREIIFPTLNNAGSAHSKKNHLMSVAELHERQCHFLRKKKKFEHSAHDFRLGLSSSVYPLAFSPSPFPCPRWTRFPTFDGPESRPSAAPSPYPLNKPPRFECSPPNGSYQSPC